MKDDVHHYGHMAVPAGAPAWITPELVADTVQTWQPYYKTPLTVMDSLEILQSVSRLWDVLYNRMET